MTLPAPPGPPYPPFTDLVARGWLRLALPFVDVGDRLPKPSPALRAVGFIRTVTVGGNVDVDVPLRRPIVTAECWVAPAVEGQGQDYEPWNAAGGLAQWVIDATYRRELMGVEVDLTDFGAYRPARVHTVIANPEPRRVEGDPGHFARYDVDLQINWTAA